MENAECTAGFPSSSPDGKLRRGWIWHSFALILAPGLKHVKPSKKSFEG
jgi:hypothetical protein